MSHATQSTMRFIEKQPKIVFVILGAAVLWWLAQYFVTHKEYDKDQAQTQSTLSEIKTDVKELLKKK